MVPVFYSIIAFLMLAQPLYAPLSGSKRDHEKALEDACNNQRPFPASVKTSGTNCLSGAIPTSGNMFEVLTGTMEYMLYMNGAANKVTRYTTGNVASHKDACFKYITGTQNINLNRSIKNSRHWSNDDCPRMLNTGGAECSYWFDLGNYDDSSRNTFDCKCYHYDAECLAYPSEEAAVAGTDANLGNEIETLMAVIQEQQDKLDDGVSDLSEKTESEMSRNEALKRTNKILMAAVKELTAN